MDDLLPLLLSGIVVYCVWFLVKNMFCDLKIKLSGK